MIHHQDPKEFPWLTKSIEALTRITIPRLGSYKREQCVQCSALYGGIYAPLFTSESAIMHKPAVSFLELGRGRKTTEKN